MDAQAARSNARAVAHQAARGVLGVDGMRKGASAASPEGQSPAGLGLVTSRAVQDTQKLNGAMGPKSRLPEMMTIITMLEKMYDLERQAAAHEEGGQLGAIRQVALRVVPSAHECSRGCLP